MSGTDASKKRSDSRIDPTRVFDDVGLFEEWDRDYYHPIARRLYDRAVAAMLDFLDQGGAGGEILDAGCGPGVHSIRAAQRGFRVLAVDASASVLQEAERRATTAGVAQQIRFVQQDLTRMEIADASVPAAFCWGVVIHIPEIDRALGELARVVSPGGRLALQVTNESAFDHKLEALARAVLGRPVQGLTRDRFGLGCWYETRGEKLWVWQIDMGGLIGYLHALGFRLTARLPVELTHLQRRAPRWIRPAMLHANNAWFRAGLPAGPAATNLLFFTKA